MTTRDRGARRRPIVALLTIAAGLVAAGCAGTARQAELELEPGESPLAAAQAFLDERRDQIETIHAGLELEWISPLLESEASCRASLVFRAPDRLRVRGTSAAFFTIFVLAADPDTIRFDVPRENVLICGRRHDEAWTRFPLDPDLVTLALYAHPDPAGRTGERPIVTIDETGVLRSEGPSGEMTFDSATALPRTFRRTGEAEALITWGDWTRIDDTLWPLEVQIVWAESSERLEARFGRVKFGRPAKEASFSEDPGDGREVLEPEEGLRRWREAWEHFGPPSGPESQ